MEANKWFAMNFKTKDGKQCFLLSTFGKTLFKQCLKNCDQLIQQLLYFNSTDNSFSRFINCAMTHGVVIYPPIINFRFKRLTEL